MDAKLLDVRSVAERLSVSPRAVWKWCSAGRLPAPVRIGRSVRWRATDLDRFIELGCPSRDEFEAAGTVGGRQ